MVLVNMTLSGIEYLLEEGHIDFVSFSDVINEFYRALILYIGLYTYTIF
jgi:hypothetical protein